MRDYIDCTPVMLTAKNQYLGQFSITPEGKLNINPLCGIPQDLYLVSKEEIKAKVGKCLYEKDQLVFHLPSKEIGKVVEGNAVHTYVVFPSGATNCVNYNIRPIIATTDKSLSLPLIPNSLIERWIRWQGDIDKVRILMFDGKPKTIYMGNGTSDNREFVQILPIEDKLYNREEVREIAAEAWIAKKVNHAHGYTTFNEWFDKNYPI